MSAKNTSGQAVDRSRTRNAAVQASIGALTALLLSFALVGSGLFLCCTPFATQALSSIFSRSEGSPFTHEELVKAAIATRDYTVGTHDRDDVLRTLYEINRSSAEAGRATLRGAPDLSDLPDQAAAPNTDELAARFMLADDTYVLTDDALSHLDDVFHVVSTVRIALVICGIVGLIGCVAIGIVGGRRNLGRTLMAAALLVIVLFIALAAWAILDFNGFFAFLHALFFAEGSWVFSADSLLIRMYPPEFWTGMGAVWLATTVSACIICYAIGILVKGRKRLP